MRILVLVAVFLGLATPARADDPQAALDAARTHWANRGLTNYGFQVQRSCFCPPQYTRRYRIHVRAGAAVGAPKVARDYDTVPKLHGIVQDAIDNHAASLSVTYDTDGVPTSIAIDHIEYAVDDEEGYTASEVEEEDPTVPSGVDDSIEDGTAATALADARRRWKDRGLTSYRFRLRPNCFCPRSFTRARDLRVRHGKPVRPPKRVRKWATVPRLFKVIERAIDDRVSGLSVTYGAKGFPRHISIDYDDLAVDEELSLTASRLHALR
jgi:hypothetical protein